MVAELSATRKVNPTGAKVDPEARRQWAYRRFSRAGARIHTGKRQLLPLY
jgi:hypothetical protein